MHRYDQQPIMIFHPLHSEIHRPRLFNNPFYYEPHPLCRLAVDHLRQCIETQTAWQEEIARGKMFGVLVVEKPSGEIGYLAAYSGQIGERADWEDFVPAVFDYLQPTGYFKTEEENISRINQEITCLATSPQRQKAIEQLATIREEAKQTIEQYRQQMAEAKRKRDLSREQGTGNGGEEARIRESQFMKAELRRLKKRSAIRISAMAAAVQTFDTEIEKLKTERKQRSDDLQNWLFQHFRMRNAQGEERDLISIFAATVQRIPPSGAGECCAPKLLQYAFLNKLRPLAMAEFWWGASPKTELRRHLHYYSACRGKCKPILEFMLRGMDVAKNPLDSLEKKTLEIVYEDAFLAVVNKPEGMLSVPGKSCRESVYSLMRAHWPDADGPLMVHRLDMATSGLLIVAKTQAVYRLLQMQFARREIGKRYVALLVSRPKVSSQGTITLPLCPDPLDRPRQIVDKEHGKTAITDYRIEDSSGPFTRITLYPHTGRTHQLRVHCAHIDGLNVPIVGDVLYGSQADRLFLHAAELTFTHPITDKRLTFTREPDF